MGAIQTQPKGAARGCQGCRERLQRGEEGWRNTRSRIQSHCRWPLAARIYTYASAPAPTTASQCQRQRKKSSRREEQARGRRTAAGRGEQQSERAGAASRSQCGACGKTIYALPDRNRLNSSRRIRSSRFPSLSSQPPPAWR